MKQAHSSRYISIYYSCSTAPPAPAPAPTPQLRLPLRQVAPHAAEPKTKRKWPAVPRATRTKRKMPAAGRSRYALPSRRSQQREASREKRDRRQKRTKGREGNRRACLIMPMRPLSSSGTGPHLSYGATTSPGHWPTPVLSPRPESPQRGRGDSTIP